MRPFALPQPWCPLCVRVLVCERVGESESTVRLCWCAVARFVFPVMTFMISCHSQADAPMVPSVTSHFLTQLIARVVRCTRGVVFSSVRVCVSLSLSVSVCV